MSTPQPGWYPDPQGFGTLRWFDGERWTDHRAPAPVPTQPAPAPAPAPGFTPQAPGFTQHPVPTAQPQPGWSGGWQPQPQPGRSGAVKALVVVGAVLGSVVLAGVVAAVAIPLFLNQRDQALQAELQTLTCETANADAIRFSQEQTPADMVALASITGSTMTVDNRGTARTPATGDDNALVLTCAGQGLWEDEVTTPVEVHVWLLPDRSLEVGATWDE